MFKIHTVTSKISLKVKIQKGIKQPANPKWSSKVGTHKRGLHQIGSLKLFLHADQFQKTIVMRMKIDGLNIDRCFDKSSTASAETEVRSPFGGHFYIVQIAKRRKEILLSEYLRTEFKSFRGQELVAISNTNEQCPIDLLRNQGVFFAWSVIFLLQ